jgi:hypothetical protein
VEKLGFSGIYLDSFGRGQHFCYARNHGHPPGGSTVSVKGMRKMGLTIRKALRKINPEIILSSEASIEQFVDIIDAKLLHYNIFTDCVPLWQTIYHDYQITYGRNFFPAKTESLSSGLVRLASVFHVGAQIARFRPDTSIVSFQRAWSSSKGEKIRVFLKRMLLVRSKYVEFLNMGEMLRPPELADVKTCDVRTRKFQLNVPEIFASAWRRDDGAVALFLTNITEKSITTELSFNRREYEIPKRAILDVVSVSDDDRLVTRTLSGGKVTVGPLETIGVVYAPVRRR